MCEASEPLEQPLIDNSLETQGREQGGSRRILGMNREHCRLPRRPGKGPQGRLAFAGKQKGPQPLFLTQQTPEGTSRTHTLSARGALPACLFSQALVQKHMEAVCFPCCRLHQLWARRPGQPRGLRSWGLQAQQGQRPWLGAAPGHSSALGTARADQGHGLEVAAKKEKHTVVNRSDPRAGGAPEAHTAQPWGRTTGRSSPRGTGASSLPFCPFTND